MMMRLKLFTLVFVTAAFAAVQIGDADARRRRSGSKKDPGITACDRLTADAAFAPKGIKLIPFESLNGERALKECLSERKRYPKVMRFAAQTGLAYEKLGQGKEALGAYGDALKLGGAAVATRMGFILRDGRGVPENQAEATRLFRLGADKGEVNAMLAYAGQLAEGKGVRASKSEAAKVLRAAGNKGSVEALDRLATMMRDGDGVAPDPKQAYALFEKAAGLGSTSAMVNQGLALRDGVGVARDPARSIPLFEAAAARGDNEALLKLAFAFLTGNGVREDNSRALRLYQQAADRGSADGMAGVAYIYANARGVDADPEKAADWLIKALINGSGYAMLQLTERPNEWRPEVRRALQEALITRKLYAGPADGTFTPETIRALRSLRPL